VPLLADLAAYGRFALGLPAFLRRRISIEEAREVVGRRLARRGELWLRLLRRGVYDNPRSPYRPLLTAAGCEPGDVERLVGERGVEGALEVLRGEGVYVTFEEFKGRRPIVRGSLHVETGPGAFANPFSSRYYHGATGGSTGPRARIHFDLDHMAATAPGALLALEANGVRDLPAAVWRPILPSVAGMSTVLRSRFEGRRLERWFSPLDRRDLRRSRKDRLATGLILGVARLAGSPLPAPETVPFDEAERVARWVRSALEREGGCLLQAAVSTLLRVALAARELGLDLGGATFWGGGEPPTAARVAAIQASGARYRSTYYLSEAGAVGLPCAAPVDGTDTHFMADALALVQAPVAVPGAGRTVPAIHLTSLLPTAPQLLLNVETDDFGIVETRACGCPLGELGLARHVRQVASYRKLTGEGMSLVGSDMVRVLEEVLPARFGGSPLDFQLVQEEDSRGFTRLALLVHPRLAAPPDEVAGAVREALREGDDAAELAAALWQQAGTLTMRSQAPETTAEGKHLPLLVLPRGARDEERRGVAAGAAR
jgi:hypothetical protein